MLVENSLSLQLNELKDYKMSKAPFLLPPQFYKNLFANALLQKPSNNGQGFPRNLLFSCGDNDTQNKEVDLNL